MPIPPSMGGAAKITSSSNGSFGSFSAGRHRRKTAKSGQSAPTKLGVMHVLFFTQTLVLSISILRIVRFSSFATIGLLLSICSFTCIPSL